MMKRKTTKLFRARMSCPPSSRACGRHRPSISRPRNTVRRQRRVSQQVWERARLQQVSLSVCLLCCAEAARDSSKVWPFDDTEKETAEPDDVQGVPESKSADTSDDEEVASENASDSARETPHAAAPETAPATTPATAPETPHNSLVRQLRDTPSVLSPSDDV